MNIEIIKIEKCKNFDPCFQADCKDCPGSPPVGYGTTKEESLAALFYNLMFDTTGGANSNYWMKYIKFGEPIIINGKRWENPTRNCTDR